MSSSIRVLYVDDDLRSLHLRSEFIEEDERIEVVQASTVEAALTRLESDDIDCILSDLNMPERSGLDFLKAVREECPRLPFILFSSQRSEELIDEALASSATDYIPKSVCTLSYRLVTHRIRDAVDHHRTKRRLETRGGPDESNGSSS